MIKTRFHDKRQNGKPVIGFYLKFPSPELVELMGHIGFDYVFIDAEHFAFGMETIQAIARAAGLTGMAAIARVPKNDQQMILGYLETGVLGIVVPHTKTADDARAIVDAVKYFPLGNRGAGYGSRAANYGLTQTSNEYIEEANRQTVAIALIEEEEGVNNLAEILAVDGIDCVDIGPADLALSMGLPGQSNHPKVLKLVEQARAQILASGKVLVFPVSTVDEAKKALASGALFVEFSLHAVLSKVARDFLSELFDDET